MPQVDPPDFIDSGSYSLTSTRLIMKALAWVLGIALLAIVVPVGMMLGNRVGVELSDLGVPVGDAGNDGGGAGIEVV